LFNDTSYFWPSFTAWNRRPMASVFRSVVKWYGPEFVAKLEKHEANSLKRVGIYLSGAIKRELSTKSGPCNENRDEPVPEDEFERSAPGEYPRLQCGELRRSITWELDEKKMMVRVGTNKIYGRYLEKGTIYMAPRPFLGVTLGKERNTVRRIMTVKMK
jgi:HK97 gp10 family phage protein